MADGIEVPRYALSAVTYVRRDEKLLLLRRAAGMATGAWYIPGGFAEAGETLAQAARRELFEEAGLEPDGQLTLLSVDGPAPLYGIASISVNYACDCPHGDVVLSEEHDAFRWVEPHDYRDRYFTEDKIAAVVEADDRLAPLIRGIRAGLDGYIAWLDATA